MERREGLLWMGGDGERSGKAREAKKDVGAGNERERYESGGKYERCCICHLAIYNGELGA